MADKELFFKELEKRAAWIKDYILDDRFVSRFKPVDIQWAVTAYVGYGGKRLRPAIVLFSCGAVGGDEKVAIPAAAAVEIFHTWTLVHDDIIDRDALRRGKSTVHKHYAKRTHAQMEGVRLTEKEADHYGVSIAILTGDIQHGWGISMMAELNSLNNVSADLTLSLINELDTKVLNTLVEGEVLDIQFAHRSMESLTPSMIEDMLMKKTGALYEFCGRSGAIIGTGSLHDPNIDIVSKFAAKCGIAFQLQDDLLGIIGTEEKLGKPVGSDLREGKRTLIVYKAYQNANSSQRQTIMRILGNPEATEEDVNLIFKMLRDLGGIDYVANRARSLILEATDSLRVLPESHYKELLYQWADFMISREF